MPVFEAAKGFPNTLALRMECQTDAFTPQNG